MPEIAEQRYRELGNDFELADGQYPTLDDYTRAFAVIEAQEREAVARVQRDEAARLAAVAREAAFRNRPAGVYCRQCGGRAAMGHQCIGATSAVRGTTDVLWGNCTSGVLGQWDS